MSPEACAQTAYTVELTACRRLLALGAALLRRFFDHPGGRAPGGTVDRPRWNCLTPLLSALDELSRSLNCVHALLNGPQQTGRCPLDAELSLRGPLQFEPSPESGRPLGRPTRPTRRASSSLDRILGRPLRIEALETAFVEATRVLDALPEQTAEPAAPAYRHDRSAHPCPAIRLRDLRGSSGAETLAAESPRSIRFPGRLAPLAILQSLLLTRNECDWQAVAPTVFSA